MKLLNWTIIVGLFAIESIFASGDLKVVKLYDSEIYFDGEVTSKIAYDHYRNKVYCVSVDTKNANLYHYYVRVLENNIWKKINSLENLYPLSDTTQIESIEIDKFGRIWICTDDGIAKYDNEKWEKIPTEEIEGFDEKFYEAVIPDSLGNVFFQISYGYKYDQYATQIILNNLYKYTPNGNKLIYSCDSTNFIENPERLSGITDRAYCADNKGNIWLASAQNTTPDGSGPTKKGMMRYNDEEGKFEFVEMVNHVKNKYLTGFIPQRLTFSAGSIWMAHDKTLYNNMRGGISKLDLLSGAWTHVDSLDGMGSCIYAINKLRTIVPDGDSRIWGGSLGEGLLLFDLKANKVTLVNLAKAFNRYDLEYKLNDVYDCFKDLDGNNWFVTWAGIAIIEGTKNSNAEKKSETTLKINPNPASEYIIIDKQLVSEESYTIVDAIGRIVLSGCLQDNMIFIEHLPTGVYNLRIGRNSKSFVKS